MLFRGAVMFKLSLREVMLVIAVGAQGLVIMYQQSLLSVDRDIISPATIRVRADSYVHPNGPVSEDRTTSDDSYCDSTQP